jgi:hypothetical protein
VTAPHATQIIDGYLARLEAELTGVSPTRRRELVDDVRAHIAEARTGLTSESDADLLNILDRLGEPADLASEHRPQVAAPAPAAWRPGVLEVAALALTPLFWPVGIILLWASPAWNLREKLIGTLIPPGGFFGAASLGLANARVVASATTQGFAFGVLGTALFAIWLLSPILTGLYLAYRLQQRQRLTA